MTTASRAASATPRIVNSTCRSSAIETPCRDHGDDRRQRQHDHAERRCREQQCEGEPADNAQEEPRHAGIIAVVPLIGSFHLADWIVVIAYLIAMGGMGLYFSRRQTSLDRYLLAEQNMGWLPVGLSLMAALNSGMDYLMQPSSTIRYGIVLTLGILSWLALYPWVAQVVFPFYHRLDFYTVYEYLEARFDVRVRTLAALIFIVWRLGWTATAMFVPSLAINAVTGGQVPTQRPPRSSSACVVTITTMLGGIQGVIWTDVVQFFMMFGGLAATVWIVLGERARRVRRDLAVRAGRRAAEPLAAARSIRPPTGAGGQIDELLRAAGDAADAADRARRRPRGAVHQRSGDGAAAADDAVAEGDAARVRRSMPPATRCG